MVEGMEGPVFAAGASFPVSFESGEGSFVDPLLLGSPPLTPVPSSATGSAAAQERTLKLRPTQKQRIQMGMYQASSSVQPCLKRLELSPVRLVQARSKHVSVMQRHRENRRIVAALRSGSCSDDPRCSTVNVLSPDLPRPTHRSPEQSRRVQRPFDNNLLEATNPNRTQPAAGSAGS